MSRPTPQLEVGDQSRRDARLNGVISWVLIAGLSIAVALLLAGAVLTLVQNGQTASHETSIRDIPGALGTLEPAGFFDLGLLVLLVTPVARVLALFVAFTRRRSWVFSGISLLVLVVLLVSALLGLNIE